MRIKKITSIILSVLMMIMVMCPCVSAATEPDSFVCYISGDANGDEEVNIKDTTDIQKHIASLITLPDRGLICADTNGDGYVNVKDTTDIQKHIAGLSASASIGNETEFTAEPKPQPATDTQPTEAAVPTAATVPTEATAPTAATTPTTATDATENSDVNSEKGEIGFTVAEQCRVQGYSSQKEGLHLITSIAEMEAVLAAIEGETDGFLYTKPVRDEKYNDAYFEDNTLIIALYALGSGSYSYSIDKITTDDGNLTIHRSIYMPEISTCDMNYQYVLIEVSSEDVKDAETLATDNTYVCLDEDAIEPTDKTPSGDTITVYFSNSQYWSNVNIHYWGGEENTSWPGYEMEFVENNVYGQDVYKYTIPADTTGIVFNEGANMAQTVDVVTDIIGGHGFYPTETENGKWKVESYLYEDTETDTTAATETTSPNSPTLPTIPVTIPNTTAPDENSDDQNSVNFTVADEGRVCYYGSENTELYLITSRAEAEAVLARIDGDAYGSLYITPTLGEEYDDAYFENNSLIISLNVVGGSCCSQTIDDITVKDGILTVHRTIFKPQNVTTDMNYQYVLIEVSNNDVMGVSSLVNSNSYITVT